MIKLPKNIKLPKFKLPVIKLPVMPGIKQPIVIERKWLAGGVGVVLLVAVLLLRGWFSSGAVAQAPSGPRQVPVEVAISEKKKVPVQVEGLGTVTPIASVAIKSRLETEIVGVHFADGATVKEGELLFTLDSRSIAAEIKRVEAVLGSASAQLEQNERDVERYTDLVAKNAASLVTLQNAKTQVNIWRPTAESSAAQIESLKVQMSYCSIRAPISGRISVANVKVGNFVRPADIAPLATINQIAPIYVSFTVPQRFLPDIRNALAAETATVEALIPGDTRPAPGQVTMIENTIDAATGMATVRATMPNAREILWPGTLVNTQLTLRIVDAVTVPTPAVQASQSGTYVFVVKDGAVKVQPVKVERNVGQETVISEGLEGGETVVTDGQLLLSNGTKVAPRERKAGS